MGVTINSERLQKLRKEYLTKSKAAGNICVNIASEFDYELKLPKSGNNKSLLEFCFGKLGLPVTKKSPLTGKPSLDALAIEGYKSSLPERSVQLCFINNLSNKRKRDTALNYLEGYERFWLPTEYENEFVLYPSFNPTGTVTLRWSSSNPNAQNISKREGFNLRYAFGPTPGREWWSLDANNIELRIPAYEAGETEMIAIFEKPDEAPYFGSYHLLVFSILHPNKWDHDDPEGLLKAKKKYASTWYGRTKGGNFAVQYGAVSSSGTADRAYGIPGAQEIIQGRFKNVAKLNRKMIDQATKLGYVEAMPDKTVNPNQGYPLLCKRTKWGKAQPTLPLNYHTQSTAMQWTQKAMVRCHNFLTQGRAPLSAQGYHMILQVHDELVFDFPIREGNLEIIKTIQGIMEKGGDDIGIPTPVSIERHEHNWSEGETI